MTARQGYRVTIEAFVPCDVDSHADTYEVTNILDEYRKRMSADTGATIERFAVEMVREDDGGMTLDEIAFLAGNRAPPNPDLDAAAAMGGMGAEKIADEPCPDCLAELGTPHSLDCAFAYGGQVPPCPVCHTPGGEHAPGCMVCKACMGEGGASQKVGQVVGPWAECGRCAGHGRVMTEESEKDG